MLKRIVGTSNQPIRTKNFPKKLCLVPYKCKGAKNSYGGHPTEFAGSTENPLKIIRTPNQLIEIKKISNKNMFSTSTVKRRQKFV
jgi:hypothetical protein